MENRRLVAYIALVVFGGIAAAIPFLGNGYDDKTTHPALTQEIVKFYNSSFPDKQITKDDSELIIKGSIEEDNFGRWMRHFYDPVHKRGLVFLGKEWRGSKDWAKDTLAQATYRLQDFPEKTLYGKVKDTFSGETDYSWDRALYEYAWGDKKRAFEALGHTLHLLEDASVPDHTRNDPHPGMGVELKNRFADFTPEWLISKLDHNDTFNSSPYETFAKFNRDNINVAEKLKNKKPISLSSAEEYIEKMAEYSNKNFFSGDTILKKYTFPKISDIRMLKLKDGLAYEFGINSDNKGNEIKLVQIKAEINPKTGGMAKTYFLKDPDKIILNNYWSLLSKQAVMHGAGMIKLFFDEVEKEKQNKILYEKNKSWLSKKMASILEATKSEPAKIQVSISSPQPQPKTETAAISQSQPKPKPVPPSLGSAPPNTPVALVKPVESKPIPESPKPPPQIPAPPPKHVSKDTSDQLPIAGVGGGGNPAPQADTTAPSAPVISSPAENYTSSSTSISFSGTAEASATVSQTFSGLTSSVTNLGAWVLNLSSLLQGTSTINFYATDSAGNQSNGASRTVFIDSTAPSASLTVNECSSSLSSDACLIATSTVNVNWSSGSTDLSYYIIECEKSGAVCASFPDLSNTTATSTIYNLPTDNSFYTFKARAVDIYGNTSSQQTQIVELATRPLVINEIAWAGTSAARASDEWVEIFNSTSRAINLASTTLVSETDSGPDIELSGTLASKAYYLIERTDDSTVSDITASTTSSFGSGLNNSGEVLALKKGSVVFDRTPTVASCGGWCGGSNSGSYPTMERYEYDTSGESSNNWSSYAGILANGKNEDNVNIAGTPGRRNSINYFMDVSGSSLTANKTIKKSNSPYIITSTEFTVQNGATMTVEPGVVIKFYNTSSYLKISGALSAQGTLADPIIFTSFKDDTYAGDTNADGAATSPAAGDWGSIKILANGSTLDRTVIKYGGYKDGFTNAWANLRVDSANATLKNSTIQKSGAYGVWFKTAFGTIDANTISENNANANIDSTGIIIEGGSPIVSNNTISSNYYGLRILSSATSTISSNTFSSNTSYAAESNGAYPAFSGSTATGNGTNGINLQGTVEQDYTLAADIPYVIQNTTYTINVGKTLTVSAGAVVKLQGTGALSASGKIITNGTPANKVVLTSIKDDTYGGDTNANGSANSPAAGDWLNITFNSTAASSTLNHTIVRYGGDTNILSPDDGAIRIKTTSIDILNSTIEYSYLYGIWTQNSTSTTISGSLIQNHSDLTAEVFYGLYLTSSSTPTIANTTFRSNETNIFTDGTSSYTDGGGIIFE